jgi:hypothetical protein
MAANTLVKITTSNTGADASSYIGLKGHLYLNSATGSLFTSNGVTPGGIPTSTLSGLLPANTQLLTTATAAGTGVVTAGVSNGVTSIAPTADQTNAFRSAFSSVGYTTDATSGAVTSISKLSQAQYDALPIKDASTLYVIV